MENELESLKLDEFKIFRVRALRVYQNLVLKLTLEEKSSFSALVNALFLYSHGIITYEELLQSTRLKEAQLIQSLYNIKTIPTKDLTFDDIYPKEIPPDDNDQSMIK